AEPPFSARSLRFDTRLTPTSMAIVDPNGDAQRALAVATGAQLVFPEGSRMRDAELRPRWRASSGEIPKPALARIVAQGQFETFPPAGSGGPLAATSDPADLHWDDRFAYPGADDAVTSLAVDGGGNLYAGGTFL